MSSVFFVYPPEVHNDKYFIMSDAKTEILITNAKGETVDTAVLEEKNSYSYFFQGVPPGLYNITGKNYNGVLSKKVTFD